MNFNLVSEQDIFYKMNKIDPIFLDIGSDESFNKIDHVSILEDKDTVLICRNIKSTNFKNNFLEILKNKKTVYCYDLKYVSSIFYELFKNNTSKFLSLFSNFVDTKILIYREFGKNIEFRKNYKEDIFLDKFFHFNTIPYQIYSIDSIISKTKDQIKKINIVANNFQNYTKKFETLLHNVSVILSIIENNGIKINCDIKKFVKYSSGHNDNFIYTQWDVCSSNTMRLVSYIHSMPNELGKHIISRLQNGKIAVIDFSCFEFKCLLYELEIEEKYDDIYEQIRLNINDENYDRSFVKNNVIKFMYGSKIFDKKVIDNLTNIYPDIIKIDDIKKEVTKTKSFENQFGFKLSYKNYNDIDQKFVNNYIQSVAAYISFIMLTFIQHKISEKRLKSKIIITKYDELVLDLCYDEREEISEIIKILSTKILRNKYVKFCAKLQIADNYGEIKT